MTIGEKIKELRLKKGWTQKKLGDMCGLADSAIRRYELGGAKPKFETLAKISSALGTSIEEILPNSFDLVRHIGAEAGATDYEYLESLVEHKIFYDHEKELISKKIEQYKNTIDKMNDSEEVKSYGEKTKIELSHIILKMILDEYENDDVSDFVILLSCFIGLKERNQQAIIELLLDNFY